jgi:hypothetical protein
MCLLVFPVGLPASTVVVVVTAAVEADQSVRVLVVVLLVGRGPDRWKDKPVVVVGDLKEALDEVEVAKCIAVSCVGRL